MGIRQCSRQSPLIVDNLNSKLLETRRYLQSEAIRACIASFSEATRTGCRYSLSPKKTVTKRAYTCWKPDPAFFRTASSFFYFSKFLPVAAVKRRSLTAKRNSICINFAIQSIANDSHLGSGVYTGEQVSYEGARWRHSGFSEHKTTTPTS